jgi:hypothetical protein
VRLCFISVVRLSSLRSAVVLGTGIMLALMSACLLTTSLDGFREDAAPVDGGGGDTSDAPSPGTIDGQSPGSDATPATDGSTSTLKFCASLNPAPMFCDDFDTPNEPLGARWGNNFDNEGELAFAEDDPKSPPRFLRATTNTSATEKLHVHLRKMFSAQTRIKCSFDLRIRAIATNKEIEVGVLAIRRSEAYFNFPIAIESTGELKVYSQRGYMDGGFFGRTINTGVKVPMETWTHFDVLLDMSVSPPIFSLRMNQTTLIDKVGIDSGVAPGNTELEVGITYVSEPATPCIADTDNVVFDDEL